MKTLGLYIHIPFCIKKCKYCDFYSIPNADPDLKANYLRALEKQIAEYKTQARSYKVTSVYLGGGTPSLLDSKKLKRLIAKIKDSFRLDKGCEFSIEVNPGTVNDKKLARIRRAGVNRVSIGVQSFVQSDLDICGRLHTVADNIYAVKSAQKAGFDSVSIDLLYGLPEQKMEHILESLRVAVSLCPDHISFYGLKVEEGTPFFRLRQMLLFPHEDLESEMYFVADKLLTDAGYQHYEISNFAKKNKACRHNLRYWNCDEYLGFGPGAHSYFAGKRFSVKKDIALYVSSFRGTEKTDSIIDEMIDIPPHARIGEYVMLRFRLSDGINVCSFYKRFGRDFDSIYFDRITPFLNSGHIIRTKKGYALTVRGMFVSNYILARIVDFDLVTPGIS